jgi:hypothetical protein
VNLPPLLLDHQRLSLVCGFPIAVSPACSWRQACMTPPPNQPANACGGSTSRRPACCGADTAENPEAASGQQVGCVPPQGQDPALAERKAGAGTHD